MSLALSISALKLYKVRLITSVMVGILSGATIDAHGEDALLQHISFAACVTVVLIQLYGLMDIYKVLSTPWRESFDVFPEEVPHGLPFRDQILSLTTAERSRSSFSFPRASTVLMANAIVIFFIGFGTYLRLNPGVAVLSYIVYHFLPFDQRRTSRPGIVFRKFSTKPDSDHFCRVISSACEGLANPITLQDSSFKGEQSVEWYGRWYLLTLFNIIVFIAMIAGAWYGLAASLVSMTLWGRLAMLRASAFEPITRERCNLAIEHTLLRIKLKQSRYTGVQTLRFSDECWQQAVDFALDRVEFAVIDITDIILANRNEGSVLWEIQRSQKKLGYKRMIFVADKLRESAAFADLRYACIEELRKHLPWDEVRGINNAQFLVMPFQSNDPTDEAVKASYVQLTLAIAKCLVADSLPSQLAHHKNHDANPALQSDPVLARDDESHSRQLQLLTSTNAPTLASGAGSKINESSARASALTPFKTYSLFVGALAGAIGLVFFAVASFKAAWLAFIFCVLYSIPILHMKISGTFRALHALAFAALLIGWITAYNTLSH